LTAREVFAVDSVGKSFGGLHVLKAASIWAWEGRITALLGRNGSGKTTLLRIAVGELLADTGIVRFLSKAYAHPHLPTLARRGLYYMEERARLPYTFSVETLLGFLSGRFDGPGLDAVLERFALEDLAHKKVDALSGGEAKRAALAAAVIRAPVCLLADEPFKGIAPQDEALVAGALRGLAAEGTAIVVTGHNVEAILDVADDVVWCVAGTTHGLGKPEEARSYPQFVRDYLGWHLHDPT
jgi:ABC-type multidrug transport system ATPase subunit